MTQRELASCVATIRAVARALQKVADQAPLPKRAGEPMPIALVAARPEGLAENARLLEETADDLSELLPETEVTLTL